MAPDPLDALRLSLMQDVLPVGLAVVEEGVIGMLQIPILHILDGNTELLFQGWLE